MVPKRKLQQTKVGFNHTKSLDSGTATIHMALKVEEDKKGDIVLCQSFIIAASTNHIKYKEEILVFINSDYEPWNISSRYLEEDLIKYPNAKAVIVFIYTGYLLM